MPHFVILAYDIVCIAKLISGQKAEVAVFQDGNFITLVPEEIPVDQVDDPHRYPYGLPKMRIFTHCIRYRLRTLPSHSGGKGNPICACTASSEFCRPANA